MSSELDKDYSLILHDLKEKIRQTRLRAAFTVNAQLLQLYWEIGNTILERKKMEGWGTKIIGRLANDLRAEFPDMKGLSQRNFEYMQTFAHAWPHFPFPQPLVAESKKDKKRRADILKISNSPIPQPAVAELPKGKKKKELLIESLVKISPDTIPQPLVAQLPWTHHTIILDKIQGLSERSFYVEKAIQNGWSKAVLFHQIESGLYNRQGKAITNFERTLPQYQSDLAREMFKNPYLFDFLNIGDEAKERELEKALMQHLRKFLLELGRGFAYVGNQYNVAVGGDDFFFDLLFYNTRLHCYVVFELKVGAFKPEYAGKLNFYLSTVDAQLKTPEDKPTIGVLLCKTPNETIVEYALRGIDKPMGVADFALNSALPKNLKSEMPTIEELEAALESEATKFKRAMPKEIKTPVAKLKAKAVTAKKRKV